MKKFVSAVLTLLFVAVAGGCSDSSNAKTEKTADELLDIVLSSVEFPQTVSVTDSERIEAMGIDISGTEEYAIVQQMLSVDVVEVIILKVEASEMTSAVKSLEKRKESLIKDYAFYPEQVASAEATVVGSKKNVAYLICHSKADNAEEKLLKEI